MKSIMHAALVSGIVGLSGFAVALPAIAQVGISVDFGDVALGYQDGYWDSHHHWHHWAHPNDYKAYSHAHPEHYRDMRHDEDHGH
jgi:hypothetical protein